MRKVIYCIITLFSLYTLKGQENSVQSTADSLFNAGSYDQCYDYLGRVMALIPSTSKDFSSFQLTRAKCLLQKKMYVESVKLTREIKTQNDTQFADRLMILTLGYIQLNNAHYVLPMFPDKLSDTLQNSRLNYAKALCYFRCDSYETGHKLARKLVKPFQKKTLDSLYNLLVIKHKKPSKASALNLFPGLGFMYVGDYRNATNSFLLNGAIIALSVYQGIKTPLLGVYIFSQFGLRYYMGGSAKAARGAVFKNNQHLQQYLNTWQAFLKNNQIS